MFITKRQIKCKFLQVLSEFYRSQSFLHTRRLGIAILFKETSCDVMLMFPGLF